MYAEKVPLFQRQTVFIAISKVTTTSEEIALGSSPCNSNDVVLLTNPCPLRSIILLDFKRFNYQDFQISWILGRCLIISQLFANTFLRVL